MLVEAHQSALGAVGVRIETLACVGTEHSIDEEGSATVQADDNETPVPSAIADAIGAAYQQRCIDAGLEVVAPLHVAPDRQDATHTVLRGECEVSLAAVAEVFLTPWRVSQVGLTPVHLREVRARDNAKTAFVAATLAAALGPSWQAEASPWVDDLEAIAVATSSALQH